MKVEEVDAMIAKARMDEGWTYIDVRQPHEFGQGHVPNALLIPLGDDFAKRIREEFPETSARLILGCGTGKRSKTAAAVLHEAGYAHVVSQRGGLEGERGVFGELVIAGWKAAGLEVSFDV